MNKILMGMFICFGLLAKAETVIDTAEIREYHQQMEEKVFEKEEDKEGDERVKEAFFLGKRRIKDAIKNEKVILESKGLTTSERLSELEILEEKYNKILEEYEELSKEKKELILENDLYFKELEKGEKEK